MTMALGSSSHFRIYSAAAASWPSLKEEALERSCAAVGWRSAEDGETHNKV